MDRLTTSFRERKDRAVRKIKSRLSPLRSTTPDPSISASENASGGGCPVPTSVVSTPLDSSTHEVSSGTPNTMFSTINENSTNVPVALITTPSLIVTPAGPRVSQNIPPGNPPSSSLGLDIKKRAWTRLETLTGVLESSSGVFGPLKSAFEAVSGCVELYETERENREEYTALKADLEARFQDLAMFLSGPVTPTMTPSIRNLADGITQEIGLLKKMEDKTTLGRYAQATRDADAVLQCYSRVGRLLDRLVQNTNMNMWKIADEQETERRLKELDHSSAAWYSSLESTGRRHKCTQETRSLVLSDMRSWAYDGTEKMYWLNGMAGTGKTTIAYSLSEELDSNRKLAASFFCSRQLPSCREVNLILPTISYQLARFSRPFRYALSGILEQNPDVHTRQFSEQFKSLIAEPLREVQETMPEDLVVVVDGLDECERQDAVDMVLDILLSEASSLPIKFFISSRPEPKIVNRMRNPRNTEAPFEFRLHELEHSIVREDIEIYLKTELEFMDLTTPDLATLTKQCGVLFIYAATAVRYIRADEPGRSPDRLQEVLEMPTLSVSDEEDTIDSLYTAILGAAFDNKKLKERDRREMMLVLHTVICAEEPLTRAMMASLLKIRNEGLVQAALAPLLSVLTISKNDGYVTTLHASFPDYLFDKDRSGRFHCDRRMHNARLTQECFDAMKSPSPPFNICRLESSFVLDKDVPGLDERTNKMISAALLYACRYWGSHLEIAEISEGLFSALEQFLQVRLLLWMEVMNLRHIMSVGGRIMSQVYAWCQKVVCPKDLRDMIMDASSFTTTFSLSLASYSTPHIYVSTLAFWPKEQPISQWYSETVTKLTKLGGTAMTQPKSPLRATITTTETVLSAKYSPDGAYIIGGVFDKVARVWDAHTGETVGDSLEGHTDFINSVSYSPDGTRIATGSEDYTIRVWDAHTLQMVSGPLKGHTEGVRSVSYSPDGAHLVSSSRDRTIRIWDAHTGKMIGNPLEGHTGMIFSASYSPDGARIVSGSADETIRIWDAHTRQMVGNPLKGHTGWVNSVSYSPNGTQIVSGSRDATIRFWDAQTGQMVGNPIQGKTSRVHSVSYSPNGAHIVSGSYDQTVRIWNAHTGDMVGEPLKGHTGEVTSVSYSPDGAHIVSGSRDRTIRIWDAHADQMVHDLVEGHSSGVRLVSYSPDGAHIVSGSYDFTIRIWDAYTGQMVGHPLEGHTSGVSSVSYSPDGTRIVSGSNDRTIRIWDAQTGQMIGNPLEGHTGWVYSVSYSPDGAHIASGSQDKTVRIWDANTGQMVGGPLEGHTHWIYSVSYSPNGAHIISGSYDWTARIWDVYTGQQVGHTLKGHTDGVCSVSYSPDGAYIVSGSRDKTIRIWDANTGQTVSEPIKGHTGAVFSVLYSPDGARLVSGSRDGTIRIWDAHTGQMIGDPLEGHTNWVYSVAYSPDGTHIVTGSNDHIIRIWDLQRGPISSDLLQNHAHSAQLMIFPPNGEQDNTLPNSIPVENTFSDWTLDERGWVVSGSSELLIWIPIDLRPRLFCPRNTVVISKRGYVQLDFCDAALGSSWSQCYTPRNPARKTV